MVDQGNKCLTRPTPTPFASCHSNLYRRLKRRLGCSLRRLHGKGHLVSSRKSSSYKLPGIKSGLTSLEKIPAPSTRKSRFSCHRPHHSCGIHQQGGRYEVRLLLCPSMVTPVLVQSGQVVLKARHIPGRLNVIADKLSRQGQIIQTEWSLHQVFNLLVQTWHRPQVAMFATKYNCKLAQYVSPVPDPNAWAVDALTVSWENRDMYAFHGPQTIRPSLQENDLDSSGLAQHAMVLGPGRTVVPDPSLPTQSSGLSDSAVQGSSQNLTNLNLHAWLLEPKQSKSKVSLVQWRHELRLLKEVQPEQSMRRSGPFLSDGVKQVRWTSDLHLSNR